MKIAISQEDAFWRHPNLASHFFEKKSIRFKKSTNSNSDVTEWEFEMGPPNISDITALLEKVNNLKKSEKAKELKDQAETSSQQETTSEKDLIDKNTLNDFKNCFKIYEGADLTNALKDKTKYHVWCTHYVGKRYHGPEGKGHWKRNRRNYESFCAGWLQYHDLIVTRNYEDHSIYFDWEKNGFVMIYISVTKIRAKSHYINVNIFSTGESEAPDPPDPPGPPPPEPEEN